MCEYLQFTLKFWISKHCVCFVRQFYPKKRVTFAVFCSVNFNIFYYFCLAVTGAIAQFNLHLMMTYL